MARRATSQPTPAWVGDLPVSERTLANGFKALVLPRHHAPVVVCDLYYPVGAVDEPPGKSGLAHFVEHMLFKGTERFPKGQIDRLAFLAAGQANAETAEDFTHYWFALPADRWELALAVEADRMKGAAFDPREVEAERRVIIEERAIDQDSPVSRLDKQHLAHAYLHHPYRNPILGWPEELERITVDDLRAFYETHYRPDGAVLVVVGDVEPDAALERIESYFAPLPRGSRTRPGTVIEEPRQTGRRSFTIVDHQNVARGQFGWHTVSRGHPDDPALHVLSDILACGRRSRLWDALVERGKLASWVDASQEGAQRGGQFLIQVEAPQGASVERIEAALRVEIEQLKFGGPTRDELKRSRRRLEAAWRWEQEDLAGLAAGLGQVSLWDSWKGWQADHRAALAVTADEVRRAAGTYLDEVGLTVGWSLPKAGRTLGLVAPRPAPRPHDAAAPIVDRPLAFTVPATCSKLTDFKPRRSVLPNGLRVVAEPRPGTGIVALELFVDAGVLRETRPGLAFLTGRMIEEGTLTRSAEALAEAIEDVGGTMELSATGASFRVRSEDLPLAMELMADVLLRPAFAADALPWARKRIVAELQADRDDPGFRADLLFRELTYGAHPYARDPRGQVREIGRLTLDEVKEHHRQHFVPDAGFLVAVGDFEPRRLQSLVKTHLGGWAPTGGALPPIPAVEEPMRPHVRRVPYQAEQVHIVIGHLGIPRNHPDYDALTVLDHIFGAGPGFNDRLSRVVRDEMGLAYSIGGGITDSADVAPGLFRVYVGTTPDEADRVVAAVNEQIQAVHAGDFTDEEVDRARRYVAGSWVFDYQTVEQRAERLLELERWELPLDDPLHWPDRIRRITPREVRAAARVHIHPEALTRIEFGPVRRRGQRAIA